MSTAHATYDPNADALYVRLEDAPRAFTDALADGIIVDYAWDDDGTTHRPRAVGVLVLGVSKLPRPGERRPGAHDGTEG